MLTKTKIKTGIRIEQIIRQMRGRKEIDVEIVLTLDSIKMDTPEFYDSSTTVIEFYLWLSDLLLNELSCESMEEQHKQSYRLTDSHSEAYRAISACACKIADALVVHEERVMINFQKMNDCYSRLAS